MASTERGEHDIENEMDNPGFVFHDSRVIETGGKSGFDKVKAFIAGRSKGIQSKDHLYAIRYCIPADEARSSKFSHPTIVDVRLMLRFTILRAQFQ
ncbi:hypothetical protein CY34DRAFT_18301 [Suillus luteus UH-Slu-Lm8-n1]|uniref:Uncharacterized protein n=1 Tax=Suillus luteus UH-Slu-Lm8-n1 TaxID=930992 RepID=A0A0D0AH43_9AGAM|nr:hypothetical protein CY34DRAFT_18301 [Suillus luteus UH-Slu-Lm8-n1]